MRRVNKSHKVPNVKLRPPPPRVRDADPSYDHSSDSEHPPHASMADLCPRPFRGFTLCATGTMDKHALFRMAFELGAESMCDFTDRVTHLIADSHGGAKYMCALERKIPIMAPHWIAEAHAIWLRGDDIDVEQGIAKHRLPIFSGVVLSLSGIDDIQRRTEINRLLTEHQGVYLKNLERPVRVTHLLCSGDTETEKMKYAEKFNKRKEAHIHLVWEEWFWDCLEFGGRFDEKKYQVSRPRPERKSLHEDPTSPLRSQNSTPHTNSAVPVDDANQPKRSTAVAPPGSFTVINNLQIDGEAEEMAIINKPVPAVTLQLWQSLLKPRGFELEGGRLVRSPSKSQAMGSLPSTPTRPRVRPNVTNRDGSVVGQGKGKEKESVISSFRRANSFAPIPVKEPTVRQPFRQNTCPSVGSGEAEGRHSLDSAQPEQDSPIRLFVGYTFRLLGEARCPNVRLAIENGGGVVTDVDAEESSFIIVRLISGSKLYRDEFDDHVRGKYRTECWLEHSVFHERICEPDENVSFTPLRITTPVPDAENVKLNLSGLDQSELCWIRRLVRAIGITLESTFSRRSTHLLCPSGEGTKFDKALEWRIPVVSLSWLEDVARTGTIPRVDEYLIGDSHVPPFDQGESARSSPPIPPQSSSPPPAEPELSLPIPTLPVPPGKVTVPSTPARQGPRSNHVPKADARPPTGAQPPAEVAARIPSSTSPSPMKLLPSSSIPNAFVSSSPVHLPDPNAIARALHESLTTLLGKRPIAEEDEAMRDVGSASGGRKGKRVRPGSNIPSREVSRENLISPPPPVVPPPVPLGDVDTSLLDGLGMGGPGSTEESLRVIYEDPEQEEERRRLLKMLGEDVGQGRRVMRAAGVANDVARSRSSKRIRTKVA